MGIMSIPIVLTASYIAMGPGGFAALPVLAATGYLGEKAYSSHTARQKVLKSRMEKLPEGNVKSMLQDFSKAADATLYLEHAAGMIQKHGHQNGKARDKAARYISKASSTGNLPAEEAQSLLESLRENRFPPVGHFLARLDQQFTSLQRVRVR